MTSILTGIGALSSQAWEHLKQRQERKSSTIYYTSLALSTQSVTTPSLNICVSVVAFKSA